MILSLYIFFMNAGLVGFAIYIDLQITPLKKRVTELERLEEMRLTPTTTKATTTRRKTVANV